MVQKGMIVLGIETSCDETAASLVSEKKKIFSNIVSSQFKDHKPFGGIVPEIAARAHLDHIDFIVKKALEEAQFTLDDIDGIAVAGGPGLIGGVMVGVMMAKGLALAKNLPFIPVNHLEAHALTVRLTNDISFPFLLLLISGGHCQFLIVEDVGRYTYLGGTLDDALGECLDKTARLLGYSSPGGPILEKLALKGKSDSFIFPKPLKGQEGCNFSFSGLKTAARKVIIGAKETSPTFQEDFSASFQRAIGEVLKDRCQNAIEMALEKQPDISTLVVSGGVAANRYFHQCMALRAQDYGMAVVSPPIKLCTDNGVMIAWAGIEKLKTNYVGSLSFAPRPRWPLEDLKPRRGD